MSMIGKTLGTFTLESQIGKGGMGEVYKAKDQKLGRDVAIKVLPEEFAKDTDRVARFQREAKLLAALNHNNIASIYGFEESDGTHFLVLELIEGDTLADRLTRGAIPVEEALKLALQIAEALEAAHEKGVIHRDLKPANIKVTPDGKVKVLDFGLAKAFAEEQAEVNLSHSPTLSAAATQQGVILGTAAYMSPEQASGEAVDKRTDIWAFGAVLFEMLTGRPLFGGNNVSQTLASVIKSEPEWARLPPNLHSRIRLLLERCLEKEAKNRYSGISDARVDIQSVLADPSGVFDSPVTTIEAKIKSRQLLLWASITIFLIIITGIVIWNMRTPETASISSRKTSADPTTQGETLWWVDRQGNEERIPAPPRIYRFPKLSPDGTKVALQVGPNENADVYIYDLTRDTLTQITFTEGLDGMPIWSDNGENIIYYSYGPGAESRSTLAIKRKAANGTGEVETLYFEPFCLFAPYSLTDDGQTLVVTRNRGGNHDILTLSLGEEHKLTPLLGEAHTESHPQLSPDGRWIAYFTDESSGEWNVFLRPYPDVEKDKIPVSGQGGFGPRWSRDGSELFYTIEHSDVEMSIMVVSVETKPSLKLGKPIELFRGNYIPRPAICYDVDLNGKRFLMVKPQKQSLE